MLHAISRKKTKFYLRYLGHREKIENHVREEDELTSLIMSPLSFFPPHAIGLFWQRLLSIDHKQIPPSGLITKATMEFWPRRGGVEPDMVVKLEWSSGERRCLLVEFKWRAPLSGADQLHKQWRNFLSEEEREHGYHIFIGPELSFAINALNRKDVWNGRLLLCSWLHILNLLRGLKNETDGQILFLWMEQVEGLLGLLHIHPFVGFNKIEHYQPLPSFPENWLFWACFFGFDNLSPPNNSMDYSTFFNTNKGSIQ